MIAQRHPFMYRTVDDALKFVGYTEASILCLKLTGRRSTLLYPYMRVEGGVRTPDGDGKLLSIHGETAQVLLSGEPSEVQHHGKRIEYPPAREYLLAQVKPVETEADRARWSNQEADDHSVRQGKGRGRDVDLDPAVADEADQRDRGDSRGPNRGNGQEAGEGKAEGAKHSDRQPRGDASMVNAPGKGHSRRRNTRAKDAASSLPPGLQAGLFGNREG